MAIEDVRDFLADLPRARPGTVAFYTEDHGCAVIPRHWRGVCCLTYRLTDAEMCEGECPLLPAGRLALEAAAKVLPAQSRGHRLT